MEKYFSYYRHDAMAEAINYANNHPNCEVASNETSVDDRGRFIYLDEKANNLCWSGETSAIVVRNTETFEEVALFAYWNSLVYFVRTQDSVNQHLLHHNLTKEYATNDLEDARRVFAKEVEQLGKEYKTLEELDYSPSEREQNHAIYCSIFAIDSLEPDEVIFIEDSDYYYE